jgi:DMSO/TMAO reductase YedYZ heme-binding membrane subunit
MFRRLANRWQLLAVCATALTVMCSAILFYRPGVAGIHVAIRATARTSLVLFLLAFSASAAGKLWPGAWSNWQLRNRRYLGLSFATSHTLHLMLIAAFARFDPQGFGEDVDTSTLVFGGIAYAFIFAMAATSFDRSAAWVGRRRWKILHTVGSWYIWLIFLITFSLAASDQPRYWLGVIILATVMLLKMVARWSPGRRPSEAPQPAR